VRKSALIAVCLTALATGAAAQQDAKTVIANAQKALGDVKSITYAGSPCLTRISCRLPGTTG